LYNWEYELDKQVKQQSKFISKSYGQSATISEYEIDNDDDNHQGISYYWNESLL